MSETTITYKGTVGPVKIGIPSNLPITLTPQGFAAANEAGTLIGDIRINWSTSNVPNQIQNATYNSLISETFLGEPLFTVDSKTSIAFKGFQCYDDGSTPQANVEINGGDNEQNGITLRNVYQQPGTGLGICSQISETNVQYNVVDTSFFQTIANPAMITMTAENICAPGKPGCVAHTMTLTEFFMTLDITATITCGGLTLENPICVTYCNFNSEQRTECLQPYIDYCFTTLPVTDEPQIEESTNCQDFFKNYNTEPGPDSRIDGAMNNYCRARYPDFNSLFDSGNRVDIDICACHMPAELYENYVREVVKLFPNFGNYIENNGINSRCLLSQCAASDYKTTSIGKICAIPQCINIASFNNDGTFQGSTVNINQTGNCEAIQSGRDDGGNGNGGGTVQETKTWIEKHWVWLVLGIGLLIILIIVILIVLAGEGNKKKKQVKFEEL